jgi:hypothetical protein
MRNFCSGACRYFYRAGAGPLGSYKRHALEPIFGILVDCFMQCALITTRRMKNSHPAQHPGELGVSFDDMIRWAVDRAWARAWLPNILVERGFPIALIAG